MRPVTLFGTIFPMDKPQDRFHGSTIVLLLLLGGLTFACSSASYSAAQPVAAAPLVLSPTPFQPGPGLIDLPFAANSPAQPQATFTPYPTPFIAPGVLPTPVEVIAPPVETSGSPLVALNNPLTGLPFSDPALAERRPLVIKIANAPDYIRPQSGLTLADVVFEYYIEWGETRFIAVYYGNDSEEVGPVRSGRYFDEHLARMYHAYYVFKFADPREYSYFQESDLAEFLVVPGAGACPPFFQHSRKRENGKKIESYNSAYFNTFEWATCAAKRGLDNARQYLRSGFFSAVAMEVMQPASRIYTHYSADDYNYWEYDQQTRKYFRYQEANSTRQGKPETYAELKDAVNGLPVTAENVVVLFTPHVFANSFEQEDEVYHIELIDSGQAFVFRDGDAIPARWYRTDLDQPLLIANLMGAPVYLRPGTTFYQVIGENSTYIQDGSNWRFNFVTP